MLRLGYYQGRAARRAQVLFFVLPPPNREPREDGLAKMWDRAAADIARRTGQ